MPSNLPREAYASHPAIVEDLQQYRQQVRPKLLQLHGSRAITPGSDAEHELIHRFITNRGLRVEKSDSLRYDGDTHTLYHPNPEDRVGVAKAYVRMAACAVKLARAWPPKPTPVGTPVPRPGLGAPVVPGPIPIAPSKPSTPLPTPAPPPYPGRPEIQKGTIRYKPRPVGSNPRRIPVPSSYTGAATTVGGFGSTGMIGGAPTPGPKIKGRFLPPKIPTTIRSLRKGSVNALARVAFGGTGDAVRAAGSDNHRTRVQLAKQILSEAGLSPAIARPVLTHTDERGVRPGVAAMIGQNVPPPLARFAAAWMGLMTGERKVTVFHPGDGEDTLHVIDTPMPHAHVGEYLRKAGVPSFTLEPRGQSTRVYVVAPMDLNDVTTAAKGLSGTHAAIRGTAVRLGAGGSDAESRSAFRQVIDDSERQVS